tara:strand:+ start:7112 stop:8266 length:1155 start_codon:yes stop_codon:yes gene_type:complete
MNNLKYILLCTTAVIAVQCKKSASNNVVEEELFQISGTIKNQPDGLIYLEELDVPDGVKPKRDSVELKDGRFSFTGNVEFPKLYSIKTADTVGFPLRFILSNDEITINAVKDSLFRAEVSGATVNAEYKNYYDNYFNKIREKAGSIYEFLDSLNEGGKRELSIAERAIVDEKWEKMGKFSDSITRLFVTDNKSSLAVPLVITDRYIQYPNPDKAEELYNVLGNEVKESFYGQKLGKAIKGYNAVAVGRQAPPITDQVDLEGNEVGLENYRGKYVLVDFWASWCAPCRKENPNVLKAYNTYHEKGLEILAISLDDKRDLWQKAIEKDGLPWKHVSDLKGFKNQAAQDYMVSAIPQNFLINPDGEIIATNLREEKLHSELQKVLTN